MISEPPVRGMIIKVDLIRSKGAEKYGTRPAIVVTDDRINSIANLPLIQIVPLTHWEERKTRVPWLVEIIPDQTNHLAMKSIADCTQTRVIDYRAAGATDVGFVSPEKMEEIDNALRRVFSL